MSSQLPQSVLVVAVVGCVLTALKLWLSTRANKSTLPTPPGPKGKPIIGNLTDLPTEDQWLKLAEWAAKYGKKQHQKECFALANFDRAGEIVHISIVGQPIVYLNSYEVAIKLLEKRSSIYSDRPLTEMSKLIKGDNILSLMPYGDKWRLSRRIFHQEFNGNTTSKFQVTQIKYAQALLRRLLIQSASFEDDLKHFSSGVILESVYGIQVQDQDDPYVRTVEMAMTSVEALVTGAYPVDVFPILRHIPDWIPGANFKKRAKFWRNHVVDTYEVPFQTVHRRMDSNNELPSNMVSEWIHRIDAIKDERERKKVLDAAQYATGTALIGGYETTSSTLQTFFFAMARYPDIQAKAQEELKKVIGTARLPDFLDMENLPYVNALIKEVMRYFPILPLGVPHRVIAEDEYEGMRIPNGSVVFPNVWTMLRDKTVFGADADTFRPERFIESELRDPRKAIFGFGRRICPGRYMVQNTLFISIASILHAFTISPGVDSSGNIIPLEEKWVTGLATHLEPFACSITTRVGDLEALIKASEG